MKTMTKQWVETIDDRENSPLKLIFEEIEGRMDRIIEQREYLSVAYDELAGLRNAIIHRIDKTEEGKNETS